MQKLRDWATRLALKNPGTPWALASLVFLVPAWWGAGFDQFRLHLYLSMVAFFCLSVAMSLSVVYSFGFQASVPNPGLQPVHVPDPQKQQDDKEKKLAESSLDARTSVNLQIEQAERQRPVSIAIAISVGLLTGVLAQSTTRLDFGWWLGLLAALFFYLTSEKGNAIG